MRFSTGTSRVIGMVAMMTALASTSWGALTITAQGTSLGFTLTKFADTGAPAGLGPIGLAVLPNGNVLVNVTNLSSNYIWPDVDGQTLGSAISHVSGFACCGSYATVGGATYGIVGSQLVKFNLDGTVNTTYANIGLSNGLWPNFTNGHLIGTNGSSIYDITITGSTASARLVNNTGGCDGIAVSPDGTTAYAGCGPISGYNILTGALTFGPITVPNSPDGMGIISSNNNLNGDIIVNGNNGSVVLIDVHNGNNVVTIANNGTRGDYTAVDQTNGSLLITQVSEVYRLSCGSGCSAGGSTLPTTPVPTAWILMLIGLAAMGMFYGMSGKFARVS